MDLMLDFFMSFGLTAFESTALVKLILASVCGALVGLEREMRGRPAGLKTFSLVCLGATLIMITNDYIYQFISQGNGDLSRMAAQVVSGIGFLGAGSIMVTSHNRVQGLTTAAALWVTAALGIAIGAGFYFGSIAGLCVLLASSVGYKKIDELIMARSKKMVLYVEGKDESYLLRMVDFFHENNMKVTSVKRKTQDKWYSENVCVIVSVEFEKRKLHRDVLRQIRKLDGVRYVEEI